MADYEIKHDRNNCISCGACAAISQEYWEMGADGKSDVKGGVKNADGSMSKEISQAEFDANKQAADACPVNVIHIVDKKTNQQII